MRECVTSTSTADPNRQPLRTNSTLCWVSSTTRLFAEADGFAHVHFHVVPRMADQPDDRKGPAIFAYLKEQPVSASRRDELAEQLRAAWPS